MFRIIPHVFMVIGGGLVWKESGKFFWPLAPFSEVPVGISS